MRLYDAAYVEWMRREQRGTATAAGDMELMINLGCRAAPPLLVWAPLLETDALKKPAEKDLDEQEAAAKKARDENANLGQRVAEIAGVFREVCGTATKKGEAKLRKSAAFIGRQAPVFTSVAPESTAKCGLAKLAGLAKEALSFLGAQVLRAKSGSA